MYVEKVHGDSWKQRVELVWAGFSSWQVRDREQVLSSSTGGVSLVTPPVEAGSSTQIHHQHLLSTQGSVVERTPNLPSEPAIPGWLLTSEWWQLWGAGWWHKSRSLQNVQHTLYWQCSGTVTKVQHSTSKPRQFVYFCPQIELCPLPCVICWQCLRVETSQCQCSAVVGEARAWLPSYGDAELATGDNGHQTADTASNGTTNWWTFHKTKWFNM